MAAWVSKGLTAGIKTTCYPANADRAPGISPGRPVGGEYPAGEIPSLLARCPVGAIEQSGPSRVTVDYRRCIHCFRCTRAAWRHPWLGSPDTSGLACRPKTASPL